MPGIIAMAAFLRRDWAITRSYRLPFAFEILDTFFSLVLFFFLAEFIDEDRLGEEVTTQGYFAYVVVGLALLTIIQAGITSFATSVQADQSTGTLEALLASPASQSLVVLGSAAFEVLRSVLIAGIMALLAVVFFDFRPVLDAGLAVALLVALPAALVLAAAVGVAIAAFAIVFKQSTALLGFAGVIVALLTGVYYPLDALPAALETIGRLLPFTWALDVLRAGVLGTDLPLGRLALLCGVAAITLPAGLLLFRLSVDHARKRGTLTQY